MSEVRSTSSSPPWGLVSLGSGALGLFMVSAGCLVGMSYFSLPFAIFGLVAAELEAQKARSGEFAEMSHATMGIVFSTITLGMQLVLMMGIFYVLVSYILFFVVVVLLA